jgi:UDP-N-acetylmuramate--alanine ligase
MLRPEKGDMRNKQKIHFIGIGGSGMSGIAEVLLNLGYRITGTDLKESESTRRLKRLGAKIQIGHRSENLPDTAEVVVVSNAVPDTNPEIVEARDRNLPVVPRAQILNDLMQLKQGVAIAGTHGKTTTTSMLAWILAEAKMDPTMVIGGVLNNINQGARMGKGNYFVVEACEAYSSFLHLTPTAVAVTNIDDDHLENYGSRAALDDAFVDFINRVPFWGTTVLNADDPGVQAILPRLVKRKLTYGFRPEANVRAEAVVVNEMKQNFMVIRNRRRLGRLQLNLPGRFNVLNALAAASMALELGVPFATIQSALDGFTGVRRRFERKGEYKKVLIVDDYAHHPTEVAATLAAARSLKPGRVIVVFQPHLFSRTQRLYKDFSRALLQADIIYVADIYPARERPLAGVSSQLIADQLRIEGHPVDVVPMSFAKLLPKVKRELQAGDLLITMGAGDVWKLGENILGSKKTPKRKAAPKTGARKTK